MAAPDADSHCFYADAWVRVKHHWSLSVDVNELIALGRILTACPESGAAAPGPGPGHRPATAARGGSGTDCRRSPRAVHQQL